MLKRRPAISAIAVAFLALLSAVVAMWDTIPDSVAAQTDACATGVAVPDPANNPGLVSDCEALLSARDTLAGETTLNWSADTPIEDWWDISLGGAPLRVTGIFLRSQHLSGRIPSSLGRLSGLRVLDLASNSLAGPIPTELGNLSNLELLDLSSNELIGEIPSSLGNLSNLEWLELSSNELIGEIPSSLGSLSHLQLLHLSRNRLSGEMPSSLGDLSNLEVLYLDWNQLTGPIPPSLASLSNLQVLFVSGNRLTGCIPEGLLDLRSNDLERLGLPSCSATLLESPAIRAVMLGMELLTITWSAPRHADGPAITGYDLRYTETSTDETADLNWTIVESVWTTGSGALSYDLTGLTNGVQYDVQMRAVNSAGAGPWSAAATGTPTDEELPPRSPGNVWYHRDGSAAVINWDASAGATHYKVYYDDHFDLGCGSDSSVIPMSCEELTGNVIGTTYTHTDPDEYDIYYWITACNSVGCSDIDVYNHALFVASAPGVPAIVSMDSGVGSLTITWTTPEQADDSVITKYDLRHLETSDDETAESKWTVVEDIWTKDSGGALRYELTGLIDEVMYDVQIRAVNLAGYGAWSETYTGTPEAPATNWAIRSISPTHVEPGGEVEVTITVAGYGRLGGISETLPDGFSYVSSSISRWRLPGREVIAFALFDESRFSYIVTASSVEGSYSFSGVIVNENLVEQEVGGASVVTVQAAPTVELSHAPGNKALPVRIGAPITVTATFREPVHGFTVDDISVANGSVSNLVGSDGDSVYTFDVTPSAIGVVTVDIAADAAEDADGNGNTAAVQLSLGIPYDDDRDGAISRDEVIHAISDYLFDDLLTREQVLAVIGLYLFSSG